MRSGALLALFGTFLAAACSPNTVCKVGGPINDPSNRTLRRNIMSYGLGQFCKQMTSRSAPLRLTPDANVIGRFFPQHCAQQMLPNGDLWVQFDGFGYAWTSLSGKVTFFSAATIQYNDDFKCSDDNAIYAYFDTRSMSAPDFRVNQIEQPVANLVQAWIAPYAENFGRQMVSGQLGQGFTVIQDSDGSTDFTVGHLTLGTRPAHPYGARGGGFASYETQRVEVHNGERDFIGPIAIDGSDRAISVRMRVESGRPVDLLLMGGPEGAQSVVLYVEHGPAGPLAGQPRFTDVVQPGLDYGRSLPVPPGMYYVVIDNTPSAGQVAPPPLLGVPTDPPAVINYAIAIGDAP